MLNRKRGDDSNRSAAATPRPFVGSLRSEFDESSNLHAVCIALQRAHDTLIAAWHRGRLEPADLLERLQLLRCADADGVEYTIGATTQRWYRRAVGEERWRLAPAPDPDADLFLAPGAYERAMRPVVGQPVASDDAP